ncbi:MAG: hypothetical protein KIT33_05715 [Candidatus Kapabacteria bacterium]|nr:hypothetical protein [Ignavibacteriota bacterium]MCW5884453.1 hypothetical protein [Candidatus Kapabacteria bacterium]
MRLFYEKRFNKNRLNNSFNTDCFFISFQYSKSQWIRNGSFENHKDTTYPNGLSGPDDYDYNKLMECIGFCHSYPADWPPSLISSYPDSAYNCDYYIGQPFENGGWYWATKYASPDYFHRGGSSTAKVPYVSVHGYTTYPNINHNLWEKRYPHPVVDSAYIGLRLVPSYLDANQLEPNFQYYKEYVQSSLKAPLGPGAYRVSFYVSRSKYSKISFQGQRHEFL